MQTISATGGRALSFRDDWELEIQKRDELYAEDPTCDFCEKNIAEKAEAIALYFNRLMKWKLAHVRRCSVELTNEEVERIRAKQKGNAECAECDEPATAGRFCTYHFVQNKL